MIVPPVRVHQLGADAVNVMAVEKVLEHVKIIRMVFLLQHRQAVGKCFRRNLIVTISDEFFYRLREPVVHHSVKRISLQPGGCNKHLVDRPILPPDFTGNISIGINFFHPRTELSPKWDPHFFRDVESPTVNAVGRISIAVRVHPSFNNCVNMLAKAGCQFPLAVLFNFWKILYPVPSLVLKFIFGSIRIIPRPYSEPIFKSGLLLILYNILKRPE